MAERQHAELAFAMGGELRRVEAPEVFPPIRVTTDVSARDDQQDQHQRPELFRLERGNHSGAEKREDKRRGTRRQKRRPLDPDTARVLNDRRAGAADRGQFVRAERRRERIARCRRQNHEEGR